jgi:hypothetical protein
VSERLLTAAEKEAVLKVLSEHTDGLAAVIESQEQEDEYNLLRDAQEILRQQGVA